MHEEYADDLEHIRYLEEKEKNKDYYRILSEVPEIEKFGYKIILHKSLNKAKQTLNPDNPFLKVKGNYNFDIDTSGASQEKTEYIHKKVADYLMEQTGKIFTFKPGDNSKIYVLGEENRSYKVSRLLQDAPIEIKKLITQYPQTKKTKVNIRISTDPLDIVKKSTHQSWESCEMVGGAFCQGIFSDIENNNAIAYIYLDNNPKPAGRFMLRWCNTPEKKADIGIEPIMYPRTSYALIVYELIKGIVESKGYGTYDECTTPYTYQGYSDYIGGSGVIKYHSGSSSEVLIQYATMPDISRNMALALAEHTTPTNVRRALAENDKVCEIEDAVNKLSKDIDDETKINLIQTCMRDTLMGGRVINRKTLPETAINNLLNDNEDVKIILAQQIIDVPESTLEKLANDKSFHVRLALAQNRVIECCDNIVNKLAADNIPTVREELVNSNVKLTEKAENILADDIEFHSGIEYKEIYNITPDEYSDRIHRNLAHKTKYPSTVRKLLKIDKEGTYIKKELALNKVIACCDDVIEKLANDKPEIAVNLLYNKEIDKPTRKKVIDNILNKLDEYRLQNKEVYGLKKKMYENIAEQPEICDYPGLVNNMLETTKGIVGDPIRRSLSVNPYISCRPDIIQKLAQNYSEIQLLAKNPAIEVTPDVVEKLYTKQDNPSIQQDLLENPAIMKVQSIKDKLIRRIDLYKEHGFKFDEPNYLNMTTSDVAYRLAKNSKLSTDKQLFDKVYELNPENILSFNPDVFERKDIIDEVMNSKTNTSRQNVLMSNSAVVEYPEIINKVMDTSNIDDVQRSLYETIGYSITKAKREGKTINDIPQYLLDAHKKLYYKLYPNQYEYNIENQFGWDFVY